MLSLHLARLRILRACLTSSHSLTTPSTRMSSSTPPLPAYNSAGASTSARQTEPPEPSWTWGQGARDPAWTAAAQEGYKTWDCAETPSRDVYRLLVSAVVPRPIALVSTVSDKGERNLAPFRCVCCATSVLRIH
jgi:hypothetical protein